MATILERIPHILRTQFTSLPYPTTDLNGKTVIVTGANVGLGLEAARHFTRLGASKVILGCRTVEKGETAKADIEFTTGREGIVEAWQLDLSSFESVKQFCCRAATLSRLDVLLENASVATSVFEESEGYENTITTNVISTFLMALLLLPSLRKTAAQHNVTTNLTIVASDAHLFARFVERTAPNVFQTLAKRENMSHDRYSVSKLIQIFLARQLAAEVGPPGPVIVNTINPGLCNTSLTRHAAFPIYQFMAVIMFVIGRTPEMGSRALIAAALAGPDKHGKYMDSCVVADPSSYVLSEEGKQMQKKLYEELMDILESIEPGISQNV